MSDTSGPASTTETSTTQSGDADGSVPIVALGASAGGVQALETFFDTLPPDPGMAFVVVMHLSPDHESILSEIIGHHSSLSVQPVRDGVTAEADVVYVLPPGKELEIDDDCFRVVDPRRSENQPTVIDTFFCALAEDQGANAVGVILSGTGTDGTQGIRALKEAGSFTMVQEPEEAASDGMPRSAVQTNLVDIVAPVDRLAARLPQYWRHSVSVTLADQTDELSDEEEQTVRKILTQVYAETGHDFTEYKRSTVLRRIGRRIAVNQVPSFSAYLERLRDDSEEIRALVRELLICVTRFFRDEEAFETLADAVIPELVDGKGLNDQVRVWSVGCATGEEAYSLAMLLHEQMSQLNRAPNVQIFATDLSEDAIETARHGVYPESVVSDLSADRRTRYLMREGSYYRVRQELREMVVFAEHNVLEDPPFSKLDLISCRNLLIYLDRDVQEHVFKGFHYALNPEGVLFLGSSESIGAAGGQFTDLDKQHNLFRPRPISQDERGVPHFPLQRRLARTADRGGEDTEMPDAPQSVNELHRQILAEEVASIVVDENHEIIHLTDPAARYLQFQGGAPTHDVLEVAPDPMSMELRSGLYQAFKKDRPAEHHPVRVEADGEPEWVQVRVCPVGHGKNFAQILVSPAVPPDTDDEVSSDGEETSEYVAELEEELRRTKEQLKTTTEEYETTTEELEASNEELLSMNEELQSKNEEIETSKEELQSVNEELKTTNQELKNKIGELRRTNSDLQNFLDATDIATLFLDRELRIERFTASVQKLFNIRQSDLGRPLTDFTPKFEVGDLIDKARTVLDRLQPMEEEIRSDEGRWFLVRIRPYRTVDDKIDGVVITFVDVTEQREAHLETQREREYAKDIVDTVRESLLVLDEDLRVQTANGSFYEAFDVEPEEVEGARIYELQDGQWDIPELRTLLEQILPEDKVINDFEVEQELEGAGPRHMEVNARRLDHKQLILLAIEDVTEQKRAVRHLREERDFVSGLVNTVGALVVVLDTEARIVRFNKECEEVTGYSAEEVKGESVLDRFVPRNERSQVEAVFRNLTDGSEALSHENHWQTKDGRQRLIRWSNTVITDEDGDVEYVVGTGIDVTRRRRLERQVIAASEEERRRIGEDLHDMLASHLAGTAMMADGIAGKLEDPAPDAAEELRKVVDLIREAGDEARALSHSLMPLSVKNDELTDGLRRLAERREQMAEITCTFETEEAVPSLRGEVASHLYRIASEAVGNAIKHGDPDAVEIRLGVEDGELVLTVWDDGCGIAPETEPTDGLGLHLMKYRAELIEATLEVSPADGRGTEVECGLPLDKIPSKSEPTSNSRGSGREG